MKRFASVVFMLAMGSIAIAQPSAPFFEDFKDGAAGFSAGLIRYNWDDGAQNMTVTDTRNGELLEAETATNGWAYNTYNWDYPSSGSLTWDTTQNKYLQVWAPWHNNSDYVAFAVSVDGGPFMGESAGLSGNVAWPSGDWYASAAFNNSGYYWFTQPDLKDVNTMAGLTDGVHQLRFRFFVISTTLYGSDTANLSTSIDWIRGGMSPAADISIAQTVMTTGVSGAPGFVGPADGMSVPNNHPTLEWTAPADQSNLTYSVTYSQDPYFRGPTTRTVHGFTSTSYSPDPLDMGTWYWTVIAVNSDGIAGQSMVRELDNANYTTQYAEIAKYYSFIVDQVPVGLSSFMTE